MEFTTIKGFRDILPDEVGAWQRVESEARMIFRSFGFREIKPPILEWTELFSRGIGQDTDIVSKEMYSLEDSKGRGLTMRPEATASVVRAYIQHRLYQKDPVQKLYTIGPMFRHERPQKGRFRQFHQVNAEVFGDPGPKSDVEIILVALTLFDAVGLSGLGLNINSLGCPDCRVAFKETFRNYLGEKTEGLCADCRRRSTTNPLRVFDCKVDSCKALVAEAPVILDFICGDCKDHFREVRETLAHMDISFIVNPRLVRGLDYYTRTTFEIQTDRLGAQNAVAGGGRYDGLVKQLGGPDHPGMGFAVGIERLVTLLENNGQEDSGPDLFLAALGMEAEKAVFKWAHALRKTGLWVELSYGSKGLKPQMKRAGRLGAKKVLIVGDDELAAGKGLLRDMESGDQREIPLDHLVENLKED